MSKRFLFLVVLLTIAFVGGMWVGYWSSGDEATEWKSKSVEAYRLLDKALDKPAPVGEIEPQFIVDQANRVSKHLDYLKLEHSALEAKYDSLLKKHEEVATELAMRKFVIR